MLELHVLGTSSARPCHGRSVSGNVVNTPAGTILVDAGEGIQQRITAQSKALKAAGFQSRTRASKIRVVLLTHGHLDHCWGLLPLLHTMALDGRREPLTIIAPTTVSALTAYAANPQAPLPIDTEISRTDCARLFQQWSELGASQEILGYPVDWVLIPVDEEDIPALLQPLDGVELVALSTRHNVPSCGWQIRIPARPGTFDRQQADRLGLSTSEISRLAQGEDIEHAGAALSASGFRGPDKQAISIILSGDTAGDVPVFTSDRIAGPINLLLHEATFTSDNEEKANLYMHSTAADAGRAAAAMGAQHLALNHFSGRLLDLTQTLAEATAEHAATVACHEGDLFRVNMDGCVTYLHRKQDEWVETAFASE